MRKLWTMGAVIALLALSAWVYRAKFASPPPQQPALVTLEDMGHLVTVKVNYADVVEFTESITQNIPWTQWELNLGGTKVLLVARGDCMVGTDLREAKYQEINRATQSAVVLLPAPKLVSARVNHETREKGGSYFYAITGTGIEPLLPGSDNRAKAIAAALNKAQQNIASTCGSKEVLETAKKNAEAVLLPALSATGWKIQLRWAQ
ncbi:MAG: DUF4230 domain-containing protein [Brachymonas sp.]|nr:DUF4230 domain-containing protein [Brachymonas sp.]